MKIIFKNQYGVEVVCLQKNENYPGTSGLTTKKGYYVYSPNQGQSWEYLGIISPNLQYLSQRFGENVLI